MDLSLLNTLRKKLHEAAQFSDVWDFFMTHFGEVQEFISLGQRGSDPFLEAVLAEVGRQLFNREVRITNLMLTRIPEYGFMHGTVWIEGKLTTAMYFEEIHKGLLAVLWSTRPPETKFVRFTGRAHVQCAQSLVELMRVRRHQVGVDGASGDPVPSSAEPPRVRRRGGPYSPPPSHPGVPM